MYEMHTAPVRPERRPVLYLDIDDTLLIWEEGHPRAAPGAQRFLLWALQRFQVRWLTTWCPGGEMEVSLLGDLCTMLELDTAQVEHIRGFDWESTESKLNGIAWLEHVVLGRPFLWIEDEYGVREGERSFLVEHGLSDRYRHCNVSQDPMALQRLHLALAHDWEAGAFRWEAEASEPVISGSAWANT
jgi:hypothetical protein